LKLTAQEEYGLRCLLQVARRAPAGSESPVAIRDVAEAEGLSFDYAAKLLRVLRQANLLDSERGACGGYRLAAPAERISLAEVMGVLDSPLYSPQFCGAHAGQKDACVHETGCSMRPLWRAIDAAVCKVLANMTLAELLQDEEQVRSRVDANGVARDA
jgi:Rrf2 family protein